MIRLIRLPGQQLITGGQIIQGGVQKVVVNAQGQQVLVNSSQAGQGQVIQVNPGSNIVTSGGQLIVTQAGQVVQQRIVSGQGAIVAQGLVQGPAQGPLDQGPSKDPKQRAAEILAPPD